MSFLFYLRWSLYHPVIILSFLFISGGCSATLSIPNIHYCSTKDKCRRKNAKKWGNDVVFCLNKNSRITGIFRALYHFCLFTINFDNQMTVKLYIHTMNFSDSRFTTIAHRNLWGEWTFVFEKSKLCSLRYTGEGVPSSVQACAYAEPDVVQTLSSTVARAYRKAVQQLNLYLAGKLHEFSLPLKIYGTDFQQKVWEAIAEIPYGETRTYQQVAEAVGEPRATRAVGAALRANPLQIILPCHRVVGKGGSLVGYALGLDLKRRLLVIEGAIPQELLLE